MFNGGKIAQHGTSIPNRFIENRTVAHGEVIVYFLSPEELAEVNRKYPTVVEEKNESHAHLTTASYWERNISRRRRKRREVIDVGN